MVLWLKADAGHGSGNISYWGDQSGYGNHAYQLTTANRPLVVESAVNGRAAIRFDGVNDSFSFPYFLSGAAQVEAYIFLKAAEDIPSANRILWHFGSTSGGSLQYPGTTGQIWEDFGSTSYKGLGDP